MSGRPTGARSRAAPRPRRGVANDWGVGPCRGPRSARVPEPRHGFAGAWRTIGGLGAMSGPPSKSDLAAALDLLLARHARVRLGDRPEASRGDRLTALHAGAVGAVVDPLEGGRQPLDVRDEPLTAHQPHLALFAGLDVVGLVTSSRVIEPPIWRSRLAASCRSRSRRLRRSFMAPAPPA